VAWLGKPGARRAALGSIGNAGPRGFLGASDFQRFSELSGCAALRSLVVALRGKLSPARRRRSPHPMSCHVLRKYRCVAEIIVSLPCLNIFT
jgi:hypothetical protein